jgi:peptide/nickel transport system permease protein
VGQTSKTNQPFPQDKSTLVLQARVAKVVEIISFILRRLAFGVLILVAIAYLSHFGLGMARGLSFEESVTRSVTETIGSVERIIQGDFGTSQAASSTLNPLPVTEVVPLMVARSMGLLGASLLLSVVVGLTLGIWAATRRRTIWSLLTLIISVIGVSVPSFLAAILLQMGVIQLTQTLGRRILPVGGFGWDAHIVLPALVLAARPVAQIARMTFISMKEVLEQDHVRTARSKGLWPHHLMINHVIRNVVVPVVTTIGVSLRFSLSSLPVVEFFFGWSGIGFYLLKSIARQDDNLTVILVLILGTLFILINLIIEIIYRVFDPRLREIQSQSILADRETLFDIFKHLLAEVRDFITNNPIRQWFRSRKQESSLKPIRTHLKERDDQQGELDINQSRIRRALIKGTIGNFPLILGTILVTGLLIIVFFGHRLAPHSPYTTQSLTVVDGKISVPPFEPGEVHPWGTDVLGRDIMSLVLAGATQTLRLAAMVVLARLAVGFILGSIAGWLSGGWVDRLVLGITEIISAFPALLLAMTLILALGIRRGFVPFVIALCFVGWGEVMQYVRGEVMSMRPKTFIEGAVAVGLRTPRILVKHVLPNLVPALISLMALEMGAVLMLLGELGFVGIFIGGGAFAELAIDSAPYHYSDVPEWSALLSNVRTFLYGYPWTALYPAIAFFIAIVGFNLFGEGIRRLVDDMRVKFSWILNRYTIALGLIAVVAISRIQGSTGELAVYQIQASNFDGEKAYANLEALTAPTLEGRSLGTEGMEETADWIAHEFESMEIQAAGQRLTYFQERPRGYQVLDAIPSLVIEDEGSSLAYHQDYVEFPGFFRNMGQVSGPVSFLGLGQITRNRYGAYPAIEQAEFSGKILVVLSASQAEFARRTDAAAVLILAEDPMDLGRSHTLSSVDPVFQSYFSDELSGHQTPMLMISEDIANRLLSGTGQDLAELRSVMEEIPRDEVVEYPTGVDASVDVQGTAFENERVRQVIGHLPGTFGTPGYQLDDKLIVVLAQYDTPPLNPDGQDYQGANDNASGLAVMLEVIRTMQESGYQPYKTFLFVAYSGEGREGGSLVTRPEIARLLQAKQGFSFVFEIEAIIDLRGLGTADGDELVLSSGGSLRLTELFEDIAKREGVRVKQAAEPMDVSVIFDEGNRFDSGEEGPRIGIRWEGWEANSRTPADNLDAISVDNLEQAGRVITYALMVIGREIQY